VREAGIAVDVFAEARVEPSLESAEAVAAVGRAGGYDGFLGVGGGSAMDTAKIAALAAASDAPLVEHINPPVGGGAAVPPLAPLVMVPTTAGTGSEATTVAVLDLPDQRIKSGISHRNLRPAQAIVDPLLVRTRPAPVIAASGLDVVCHAAESFLARATTPVPRRPSRACARPTRARTRSRTSGRARRSSSAGASCAGPSPTARTSRRAG
jgi:alcohol dehydrogenase class IV